MENKKELREVITWSINVKWNGAWRQSPAYSTYNEALANLAKFCEKFHGKFLSVTIVRNVRFEAA